MIEVVLNIQQIRQPIGIHCFIIQVTFSTCFQQVKSITYTSKPNLIDYTIKNMEELYVYKMNNAYTKYNHGI